MMNNGNSVSKSTSANSTSRQSKRPTPLRVAKEEVRQYRPPVIIHTYSPKIIHVDAAEFSTLVQQLTGRGLKRKPERSPLVRDYHPEESSCLSPSSSADSELPGAENGVEGTQGFASPRGPLVSYPPLYPTQYEASCTHPQTGISSNDNSSNLFTNGAFTPGSQYSSIFGSNSIFSPLPSPSLINSSFMHDLPVLSPSTYPNGLFQNHHFDLTSHFNGSSYGKFVGGISSLQSPGSNNTFKELAMLSREPKG